MISSKILQIDKTIKSIMVRNAIIGRNVNIPNTNRITVTKICIETVKNIYLPLPIKNLLTPSFPRLLNFYLLTSFRTDVTQTNNKPYEIYNRHNAGNYPKDNINNTDTSAPNY